jgi:ComF family protein
MPVAVNQSPPDEVDVLRARLGFWLRNDASHLLWPARCLVCAEAGEDARDLCRACSQALPWNRNACVRCALPLPLQLPMGASTTDAPSLCGQCLRHPPPLQAAHAACLYDFPIDQLLPRFKFHRDLAAGRLLAQLMAEAFTPLQRPQAVIALPLHRSRLRARGYDQALELARPLARALQLPLFESALRRTRATTPQSELSALARHRNLRGAFACDGADLPAHVVLVDDVMTTGATLHAAAKALRRAGVERVDAWVCARVP